MNSKKGGKSRRGCARLGGGCDAERADGVQVKERSRINVLSSASSPRRLLEGAWRRLSTRKNSARKNIDSLHMKNENEYKNDLSLREREEIISF